MNHRICVSQIAVPGSAVSVSPGNLLGKQILNFHFKFTETEALWGRRVNNLGFNKLEGGSESQQSLKITMIELLSSWLQAWTPESDRSSNSGSATK